MLNNVCCCFVLFVLCVFVYVCLFGVGFGVGFLGGCCGFFACLVCFFIN